MFIIPMSISAKKKICPTCNKLDFMWTRRFGCKSCSIKAKLDKISEGNKSTWMEDAEKRLKNRPSKKKIRQMVRQVSSKRARQNQAYSVARKLFLKSNPNCAVFPHLPSTEIHHSAGRRGDMLLDTRFWFAVSRQGHTRIHENPEWAEEHGFLIKGRNSK
jgi:hypothetical protein